MNVAGLNTDRVIRVDPSGLAVVPPGTTRTFSEFGSIPNGAWPIQADRMGKGFKMQFTRPIFLLAVLSALLVPTMASADIRKGEQLYNTFCMSCHGMAGRNPIAGAPSFSRGEGMMKPDAALITAIKSGRRAMPAFSGVLSDLEIHDVITYLRTLRY